MSQVLHGEDNPNSEQLEVTAPAQKDRDEAYGQVIRAALQEYNVGSHLTCMHKTTADLVNS